MRRKRRADKENEKVIAFDPASRHAYINGFGKRKEERRKFGIRQHLEQERQDRMEVKRDHRNDVKKKWKDLQRAEKRVEALLGLGPSEEIHIIGGPDRLGALEDGEAPITVTFEEEDDDPFGNCEVTTTVGGISTRGEGHLPLALISKSGDVLAQLRGQAGQLRDLTGMPEDLEVRQKRRIESSLREEEKRQKSLTDKVTKLINMKHKGGVKKKRKVKGKKGSGRMTRKERRKSMQKAQRKNGRKS